MPRTRKHKSFQVIENGITFQFESAPEGGYVVTVPDLPGCISEGDTFEEALEMIKDAMAGWLASARQHGDPVPARFKDLKAPALLPR